MTPARDDAGPDDDRRARGREYLRRWRERNPGYHREEMARRRDEVREKWARVAAEAARKETRK